MPTRGSATDAIIVAFLALFGAITFGVIGWSLSHDWQPTGVMTVLGGWLGGAVYRFIGP
jgi:hypothetical protein